MAFMTNKDIHIAVKRNEGVQYLMKHFGFATEEALFEEIRRISPLGAEEFIRKLKNKQKGAAKRKMKSKEKNLAKKATEVAKTAEVEEQPEAAEITETSETTENSSNATLAIIRELEELKKLEAKLSLAVCDLEVLHGAQVATRRQLLEELVEAKKELEKLQEVLASQQRNVTRIYEEYNRCAEEMAKINAERKALQEQLESVRTQITELRKVTLFIYQNGDIEVEEGMPVQIWEEDITLTFNRLIRHSEVGNLTINEVKTVAKLHEMVRAYQAEGISVELFFDSSAVQTFWEAIIA